MADIAEPTTKPETVLRWILPRNREYAKDFVRHAVLHILLHLAAYVLIMSLALHFLMPRIFTVGAGVSFILHILLRSWPAFVALIPAFALILWGLYALRLRPIVFEINDAHAGWSDWTGRHFCEWSRFKAYRIDNDPRRPGLRLLKLKAGASFGRAWLFDPTEIDEANIREMMADHGVPDSGSSIWYTGRRP